MHLKVIGGISWYDMFRPVWVIREIIAQYAQFYVPVSFVETISESSVISDVCSTTSFADLSVRGEA